MLTGLLTGLGVLVIGTLLLMGILWLKRGHMHPDTWPERSVIFVLVVGAAALLGVGIGLDNDQLASALIQMGAAVIGGAVVGIVVLVLTREGH